jgi:hypothetical protein
MPFIFHLDRICKLDSNIYSLYIIFVSLVSFFIFFTGHLVLFLQVTGLPWIAPLLATSSCCRRHPQAAASGEVWWWWWWCCCWLAGCDSGRLGFSRLQLTPWNHARTVVVVTFGLGYNPLRWSPFVSLFLYVRCCSTAIAMAILCSTFLQFSSYLFNFTRCIFVAV